MSVVFKVEDGTAYSDSTSYVSVAQYQSYCDKFGYDYSADTSDNIEVYLNQATAYIDRWYVFKGFKQLVWTQKLEWPRILTHQLGRAYEFLAFRYIQANEIPKELIEATCYLAYTFKTEGALEYINKGEKRANIGPVSMYYDHRKGYIDYPVVNALFRYLTMDSVRAERVR
jgi:hypothetical protein